MRALRGNTGVSYKERFIIELSSYNFDRGYDGVAIFNEEKMTMS